MTNTQHRLQLLPTVLRTRLSVVVALRNMVVGLRVLSNRELELYLASGPVRAVITQSFDGEGPGGEAGKL